MATGTLVRLKDKKEGNIKYPVTVAEGVSIDGGNLVDKITTMETNIAHKNAVTKTIVTALPDTLVDNTIYVVSGTQAGTFTIPTPTSSVYGIVIQFTAGSGCTLAFNNTPVWLGDVSIALLEGSQYVLIILDGIYSINELTTQS